METKSKKKQRTPKEAIRAQCLDCVGGHKKEIASCNGDGSIPGFHICPFHPYRLGKGRPSIKLIRKFCLQCMGGSKAFIKKCSTVDCKVNAFRFGKNPARAGIGRSRAELALLRSKVRS